MFNLVRYGEQMHYKWDNKQFFSDISVYVNLIDHNPMKLNLIKTTNINLDEQHQSGKEFKLEFVDDEKFVSVKLIFKCTETHTVMFVEGTIHNDELFKPQTYFAPVNGINIYFQPAFNDYQLMANYQHKVWWTRPFFGKLEDLPEKTISLLIKDGEDHIHFLPVSDSVTRADLLGNGTGFQLSVSSFHSGLDKISQMVMAVAVGSDPYETVNRNVEKACRHLGNNIKPRTQKDYPEILDYLGWCSWDAFYHDVNEKGIIEKAIELKEKNIPVKWVMIDDGWSELKDRKLKSFKADAEKFPNGLSHVTGLLKGKYGVRWVGVWHTIGGYWQGIAPGSDLARDYEEFLYKTKNGAIVPYPQAEKGFGFWNAWHSYLKQQGVDFVKVDSQSAVNNFLAYHLPIGEATAQAHTALEASTSLHFDNTVINCMGMSEENIWHRPYSSVSRNSDDFVPKEKGSFKEHALQNVYNSMFHSAFYWGDWDMFWTDNHDDVQNMVLRAVSGGPIYFSDEVGKTNPENILPLVYNDGKIIRCDQPGLPTEDSLFIDPFRSKTMLKVWNMSGNTGIVAGFNIFAGDEAIQGTISPQDVPYIQGDSFIAYDVLNGHYRIVKRKEQIKVELPENGVILILFIPLKGNITPIGLVNKLISNDSILNVWETTDKATILLKEGGKFAFISKDLPKVSANGTELRAEEISSNPDVYLVNCEDFKENVLLTIEI